jgi:thioredoxin 1
MSEKNIEQKITDETLLIAYFSYPACNVCKVIRPKIEALLVNYPNVNFAYINTEEERAAAGQNSVFAVPTIILFNRGKELKRWSRNFSISDVELELERIYQFYQE